MPSAKLIESKEWTAFAPAFMQLATSGPGVAPAQDIVNRAEKFLPFSQATTVVDMGCGPGQLTHAVLEHQFTKLPPSARIVGADNNAQMLQQYTERKQKEIADGNVAWQRVEVIQTDVQGCSAFANESVSHMLANFVVFLVPEPVQAVRAMKRVIAPGGVLAMSSWQGSEWQDLMYYPKKVRPDLIMPEPPATWTSPEGVHKQLEDAGFRDIIVVEGVGFLPFHGYEEICRFILTKLPLAARVVKEMSDDEVLRTFDLMVADLKAKYPTLPAKMAGKATIAYARK